MTVGGNSRRLPSLREVEPLQIVERGDLHRVLHDTAVAAGVRSTTASASSAVERPGWRSRRSSPTAPPPPPTC